MKKNYPPEFSQNIKHLLQKDAPLFWEALESDPPVSGLRIHPTKTSLIEIQEALSLEGTPLPWTDHGIEIQKGRDPGKHPYHGAGLYYLQEPSAMVPVDVLDPQPGERVLDLCAAPGGKTTQIQSRMGNKGLIIANDSNPRRVQALSRNLERWGARNTPVLCETPRRLSEHLGEFFDKVLVDAPCSGEGTFRSDPGEIKKWSPAFSIRCSVIQDEILWFAGKMVRPGGQLVYSTCTFNQEENEKRIAHFLNNNPDFSLDPIARLEGFSPGIQLENNQIADFSGAVRIWPHLAQGEGHFVARLIKAGRDPSFSLPATRDSSTLDSDKLQLYETFFNSSLRHTPNTLEIQPGGNGLRLYGNRLYWVPPGIPALAGLNVRHWGWWLGTIGSDQFIPGPALAPSLAVEDAQKVLEFSLEDSRLASYLRGSPISGPEVENLPEGWVLVACSGHPLGWGKIHRGRMKSHFPRWLRSN